jgi:Helicase HerA, central domain
MMHEWPSHEIASMVLTGRCWSASQEASEERVGMSDGLPGSAAEPGTLAGSLTDRVDEYRRARGELERGVLPLATSVDGRQFTFQASLHELLVQTGGYVVLEGDGRPRLGQVLTMRPDSVSATDAGLDSTKSSMLIRLARGDGVILDGDLRPFHDAVARPAQPPEVDAWLERIRPNRSALTIGDLLLAPGVAAALDAGGFNRHSFMCGQSGSGKTYSLGLVLERLLVGTSLRMVILDPNSDYVRLSEVRDGTDPALAAEYAAAASGVSVWRNDPDGAHRLRLQLADVDSAAQAALLGLDPIRDREEYAALSAILATSEKGRPLISGLDALQSSDNPDVRQLGLRAANLGVMNWSIWSGGQGRSLVDELEEPTARCIVVDLGSLDTIDEQRLISETVLSTLWRNRSRREPCLIIIDEAHNVCPRQPADAVTALATNYAALIAAEGRKFGLYLLASTQRPQKVHEEVLSQCDNLLLMRMNSEADLGYLREVFSFVPAGLIQRATTFQQGQGLIAGKFFPHPTYVTFGQRYSQEGGADIPTSWASPG